MSRGLEAVYKLQKIDDRKAIYAYSGDDFSFPYDRDKSLAYDGRIEVLLSVFENEFSYDLFMLGEVKVTKDCYHAQNNNDGIDILALFTIRNIYRKYKETNEIPLEGHWIV